MSIKSKRTTASGRRAARPKSLATRPARRGFAQNFLHEHSLSLASIAILGLWTGLYSAYGPGSHSGSFFGNAIADWLGVVVMVIATKYFFETGSAESNRPPGERVKTVAGTLRKHSLSIFIVLTGVGWVVIYGAMDSEAKWGQVVGNIVSEWTQIFGLLFLTKRLIERHSKESAAGTEKD